MRPIFLTFIQWAWCPTMGMALVPQVRLASTGAMGGLAEGAQGPAARRLRLQRWHTQSLHPIFSPDGPPGGWGGGAKSGLVVLRGRAVFPAPFFPFFPYVFLCVGQWMSGWMPLDLTPPWGWVECCGCLPTVGASPSHSCPPPPFPSVAEENHGQYGQC